MLSTVHSKMFSDDEHSALAKSDFKVTKSRVVACKIYSIRQALPKFQYYFSDSNLQNRVLTGIPSLPKYDQFAADVCAVHNGLWFWALIPSKVRRDGRQSSSFEL